MTDRGNSCPYSVQFFHIIDFPCRMTLVGKKNNTEIDPKSGPRNLFASEPFPPASEEWPSHQSHFPRHVTTLVVEPTGLKG